jgi:hypothetical protein
MSMSGPRTMRCSGYRSHGGPGWLGFAVAVEEVVVAAAGAAAS